MGPAHFTMVGGRLCIATWAKHPARVQELPMHVVRQNFTTYNIGQEAPWPKAVNLITVTLQPVQFELPVQDRG